MKKYLLFAGEHYYPFGGWDDFQGAFDSVQEAKDSLLKKSSCDRRDWWHIVEMSDKPHVVEGMIGNGQRYEPND